jgi:polysaccharide pyruvyl transferase WcaK-like protein
MEGLEPKKYDCVIWGGYAHGNTGDELCLSAACQRVRHEFGPAVVILSGDPEYTTWLFPDVMVVPFVLRDQKRSKRRRNFWQKWARGLAEFRKDSSLSGTDAEAEWKACLGSARRLYLAGGGYLTDLWSLDLILPPLELAVQLKLPISTAPIGIGPFKSGAAADRVAKVLDGVELKVRDRVSHDFCRARGLPAVLEPDDAYGLDWLPAKNAGSTGDGPRTIGVCIFEQYGQDENVDLSDWWTECLRGLQRQHPEHTIEGFCFHTSPEAEFRQMVRLFGRAGLPVDRVRPPHLDFRQAVAGIRGYDFIISTRFHAVVAANVMGISNIAMATGDYYRAKMNSAVGGHQHLSTLVDAVRCNPEAMLEICKGKLTPGKLRI